jgi:hypothetical protein
MIEVGFEPTPPKRPVPETGALDRSAIQPSRLAHRGTTVEAACPQKQKLSQEGLEPPIS